MSENKECCDKSKKCCGGAAVKVFLVLLVLAGIAGLAFMSGKMAKDGAEVVDESAVAENAADAAEGTDPKRVLAKVGEDVITVADALELVQMMPPQMRQIPQEQLLPMALEQVINNKIISKQADSAGLGNDAEVKKQVAMAKEQIVRSVFVEREVAKKVSDEQVRGEYEQYVKNFPEVEEVRASHILVDEEAKAKDIIKKLNSGGDFAELAKENSTDGTAQSGGDLGYFSKDDVVPDFAAAAFSTEPGSYSKAPVKTEFGYHVIKVAEKRVRPPADYEQVKPYIEQELRRTALEGLVQDWKSNVKIERYDENGNVIPSQEPAPSEEAAAATQAPQDDAPVAEEGEAEPAESKAAE